MFVEFFTVFVITLSFFLSASVGFGAGLIAIPILALIIDTSQAITLVLFFQLLQGVLVFFNYKVADWPLLKKILPGIVIGTVVGTMFIAYLPQAIVSLFLGVIVLLYTVRSMMHFTIGHKTIQKVPTSFAGLLGGVIHGAFGVGGSVFVIYYKEMIKSRVSFRASLFVTFFICNFIRLFISVPTGLVTDELLFLVMVSFIPFLLALYIGQKLHDQIHEKLLKHIIDGLLLLSSVSLIVKSFL